MYITYHYHWKTRGNPDVICSIKKEVKLNINPISR